MEINSKAQGATEYLIILAIVIVIALVAVGVLGGIPGIGGSTGSRASQTYWSTADVAITSLAISDNGTEDDLNMNVRNNLPDKIRVNNISLEGVSVDMSPFNLNPGQSKSVTDSNMTDICAAGESFSLDVVINYENSVTDASYTFTGGGTQIEGTCAD